MKTYSLEKVKLKIVNLKIKLKYHYNLHITECIAVNDTVNDEK